MKITIELPPGQFTVEDRKRIAGIIGNLSALVGGIVLSQDWGGELETPCAVCGHLSPWHQIGCDRA